VGKKVPAASAVAIVVEPRAEDEVGGYCEEDTETHVSLMLDHDHNRKRNTEGVNVKRRYTHMMKNHPKKPQ
jgi:hypothetical protein